MTKMDPRDLLGLSFWEDVTNYWKGRSGDGIG
jgi:hypothetical protein